MLLGVPEAASTKQPLMKSLVNLISGISNSRPPRFFFSSSSATIRSAAPPRLLSLPMAAAAAALLSLATRRFACSLGSRGSVRCVLACAEEGRSPGIYKKKDLCLPPTSLAVNLCCESVITRCGENGHGPRSDSTTVRSRATPADPVHAGAWSSFIRSYGAARARLVLSPTQRSYGPGL